jgi:hypothetical protein
MNKHRGVPPVIEPLRAEDLAQALQIDLSPSLRAPIDGERLALVADRLKVRSGSARPVPAKWDDPLFWNVEASSPDRSQYFAIGNAINFRFWELAGGALHPMKGSINGQEYRGSMYMWRCLRRCWDTGTYPILDAEFLANISAEQFDTIFADDAGRDQLSIARDDRISNLQDLGHRLASEWDGLFYNLLRSTDGSLVSFAALSRSFRAYDDPLCKLTMVNAILHSGSGLYAFHESPLPGIDYEIVKQLLRQEIVRPDTEIREKLTGIRLLSADEAYELRRSAMVAMIALSDTAYLSGDVLDNLYWLNRVNCVESEPVCQRPGEGHKCPFWGQCAEHVEFHRPLELTRYY